MAFIMYCTRMLGMYKSQIYLKVRYKIIKLLIYLAKYWKKKYQVLF